MNPKLRALLERKQKALAAAKAISTAGATEDRDLNIGEQRQFDALMSQVRELNESIKAEEDLIEGERSAPALPADRLARLGGGDYPQYLYDRQAPTGRRYAQLFAGEQIDSGGFSGVGEFLSVIRNGLGDPRLMMAASGGSEGVGADGGVVVPSEFVAELMDDSLEDEIVRPRAAVRPMTSSSLWVAGFDLLQHGTGIGGFVAAWAAEGSQLTFQKAKTRPMNLKAAKLGLLTAASNELLADSSYYSTELPSLMVKAIGYSLDSAFLTGDGVGKPKGVLNDPALITVTKEAGQVADTINYENIKKMFQRLHPNSRKNAVWVITANATVQLLSLIQYVKNAAGTENVGGWGIPVMREENGKFSMLGIEAIFTEKLPVLGDKGDIMLADFRQYFVGLRREMTIDKSGHLLFDKDETAFRGILRADGQGRWNAPASPWTGSETTSWCVTLEARA